MKKILLASDLSPQSEIALKRAVKLSEILKAKLHILHVVGDQYSSGLVHTISSMAEERLKRTLKRELSPDAIKKIKIFIVSGDPSEEILLHKNKLHIDLTVLGMHRKPTLSLFMGTTTDRVSRYNSGITLMAKNEAIQSYTQVLCLTDFSPAAKRAIKAAYLLAPDAHFTLAHFTDQIKTEFLSADDAQEFRNRSLGEAEEQLKHHATVCFGKENLGQVELFVDDNQPMDGILEISKARCIDLIALGKHDKSGITHIFSRSVSRSLLAHAPCDLLLAKM